MIFHLLASRLSRYEDINKEIISKFNWIPIRGGCKPAIDRVTFQAVINDRSEPRVKERSGREGQEIERILPCRVGW
jgi:hypothetical protein